MDKVEEKLSVEQGNKLIRDFMYPDVPMGNMTVTHSGNYNTHWEYLMPVIKKLNGGRPHSAMLWEDITKALIDCDIERTWAAVVAYIKWFYKK